MQHDDRRLTYRATIRERKVDVHGRARFGRKLYSSGWQESRGKALGKVCAWINRRVGTGAARQRPVDGSPALAEAMPVILTPPLPRKYHIDLERERMDCEQVEAFG